VSRRRASVAADSTSREAPPTSAPASGVSDAPRPALPRKHPWQLAIASVLLGMWILFLAWMAWATN
jgi:hypothetical protein